MKNLLIVLAALVSHPAFADTIHIGFTLAATGPAASLGIPQRNSVALMPREIAGDTIDYTVLDDGGDPTRAVANMRKLIDEDHADVIIGSSVTRGLARDDRRGRREAGADDLHGGPRSAWSRRWTRPAPGCSRRRRATA